MVVMEATPSAICESWNGCHGSYAERHLRVVECREKPTARPNRSLWLPLEGICTVKDLTLNDFDMTGLPIGYPLA